MIYPRLELDGKPVHLEDLHGMKLSEEDLDQLSRWACAVHQRCLEVWLELPKEAQARSRLEFGGTTRKVDMSPTAEYFVGDGRKPVVFSLRARWILCWRNRGKRPIGYEEAIRRASNPWCLDFWLSQLACW